ncbi:MAG TPA: phospho-N-acetylmuramoyl-pentapeptide-transferase [Candidatus Dormibacteraeota bacterium]
MTRAVAAFVACLVLGLALYPALIGALARRRAAQRVSEHVPQAHLRKVGTPTMGGLLFCALAIAAWLALDRSRGGFLIAFAVAAGALIGALDDVTNIRGQLALGILPSQKLAVQGVVGLLLGIGLHASHYTREVFPGLGTPDLGWLIVPLAMLAVVATSNAVNLTDGVDGLAASCGAIALITTWGLAAHAGNRPVAIACAAMGGGVLAFLAYNWWPARVFMGDTGSLALGSGLAVATAEAGLLWLLPLLGVVFLAETLSVIINVTAIRRYGRRVFRASPLHHHFEEMGLREQRLVLCFAGAGVVGALLTCLVALRNGMVVA